MHVKIFQLLFLIRLSFSLAPSDLLIFIISQHDVIHQQNAENLRSDLLNQSLVINREELVDVRILHEIFNHPGYWTILPVLPHLVNTNLIKDSTKWIIFCEDSTRINLFKLVKYLSDEDYAKEQNIGYALHDREATIIHHFSFFENPKWFPYPLIRSGVIFTVPFVRKLANCVTKRKLPDFFIDVSHELSLFIWNNMKSEKQISNSTNTRESKRRNPDLKNLKKDETCVEKLEGNNNKVSPIMTDKPKWEEKQNEQKINLPNSNSIIITDMKTNSKPLGEEKRRSSLMRTAPFVCSSEGYECAIYPNEGSHYTRCEESINVETIFFAIKTCQKFHKDRIPIVEQTWGQYAVHKRFYSDIDDESIPTISTGVPNTESGHCEKTLSILELALKEIENLNRKQRQNKIQWIFLSDDDTLLSVSGVCDILSCFHSEKDLYLGERYGYRLHSIDGFNYITGGGGIIFSLSTVRKIIKFCSCPSISSPDDMIIGACLQRLGVKLIHSSRFHQARPPDYPVELLNLEKPISFHKFWQIDPIWVYEKWFRSDDSAKLGNSKELLFVTSNNNNSNNRKFNCDNDSSQCKNVLRRNCDRKSTAKENVLSQRVKVELQHVDL